LRRLHRAFLEKSFCTVRTPLGEYGLANEVVSKLVVCVLAIHCLPICVFFFFAEAFIIFILLGIFKIGMERHACFAGTCVQLYRIYPQRSVQHRSKILFAEQEFCQRAWDFILKTTSPFRVIDEVAKHYYLCFGRRASDNVQIARSLLRWVSVITQLTAPETLSWSLF